jgi:hypothetical protein
MNIRLRIGIRNVLSVEVNNFILYIEYMIRVILMKTESEIKEVSEKELIPKFSHNSKVEIIKGFYKGYTGVIKSYTIVGTIIRYQLEVVEMENCEIYFNEDELRVKPKFLGIF